MVNKVSMFMRPSVRIAFFWCVEYFWWALHIIHVYKYFTQAIYLLEEILFLLSFSCCLSGLDYLVMYNIKTTLGWC